MARHPTVDPLRLIGNTPLDPLEDVLFRHWLRAHGLLRRRQEPDELEPPIDWRGVYRQLGGQLVTPTVLRQARDRVAIDQRIRDLLEA